MASDYSNGSEGKKSGKEKRLFLALNLPPAIKDEIGGLIDDLRRLNRGIRWVDPTSLHLTLHFLGYLDETAESRLIELIDVGGQGIGRLDFSLGNIDAFPGLAAPRVIILRCEQTNGQGASKLTRDLKDVLVRDGFAVEERAWHAHITLGRVKFPTAFRPVTYKWQQDRFSVDTFELMESRLSSRGAEYIEVASFKLQHHII